MSTWNERAEDYAVAHHTYDHLDASENALYASGFVRGARWQREALLSDETVERVAHGIHASHDRGDWENGPAEVLDEYLNMARVALAAAIGDDDE